MINCLAQELYNTEAYSWIIIITLTSIQVFIEFFHEKEKPSFLISRLCERQPKG